MIHRFSLQYLDVGRYLKVDGVYADGIPVGEIMVRSVMSTIMESSIERECVFLG